MPSLRGQDFQEEYLPDQGLMRWVVRIKHPFRMVDGRFRYGLNDKLLSEALRQGIDKIVVRFNGGKEILLSPLTEKELKGKKKRGEFEHKDSMFRDSSGFDLYHFTIN